MWEGIHREDKVITGREDVKDVEEFVYLGGDTEDIKKCQTKVQGAVFNFMNTWNTRSIGRDTKTV